MYHRFGARDHKTLPLDLKLVHNYLLDNCRMYCYILNFPNDYNDIFEFLIKVVNYLSNCFYKKSVARTCNGMELQGSNGRGCYWLPIIAEGVKTCC